MCGESDWICLLEWNLAWVLRGGKWEAACYVEMGSIDDVSWIYKAQSARLRLRAAKLAFCFHCRSASRVNPRHLCLACGPTASTQAGESRETVVVST